MNSKRRALLWLGVALLIQLLALAAFIGQYERIVHQGTEVRLPCTGVDPYDPFRGRYVRIRTTLKYSLKDDAEREFAKDHAGKALFVRVAENPATPGLFQGVELSEQPRPEGIWMPATLEFWSSVFWDDPSLLAEPGDPAGAAAAEEGDKKSYTNLNLPQQQLFLNEQVAFRAEELLAQAHENAVAVYRVRKSRAVLMDIEVDGKSLRLRASEAPDAAKEAKERAIDPDSFSQRVM